MNLLQTTIREGVCIITFPRAVPQTEYEFVLASSSTYLLSFLCFGGDRVRILAFMFTLPCLLLRARFSVFYRFVEGAQLSDRSFGSSSGPHVGLKFANPVFSCETSGGSESSCCTNSEVLYHRITFYLAVLYRRMTTSLFFLASLFLRVW